MHDADLIRMANQIAGFFKAYPHEEAVRETANHIKNFWDPRMRRQIHEIGRRADSGLDPLVIEALPQVPVPATAA
ncbi:formate dehydrogenase subunit delta [Rhodoligotrophos defluvii]|uniref:formate dehydrogenase subunit delta n=1 Tax=Rhodoligotrophos defluvii TaxID=2561934 RepID=UPI0010C9C5E2|nr:formate dehydrogenase subunit delta [Rhodoligotrophos defluvii]